MGFEHFLQWLSETSFSATMRESVWAEPLVETIHVLTLTLFLGFVLFLDLRLLDVMLRHKRVSEMFAQFNPWLFGGFAVMLVTGLLLFSADPVNFYSTLFFNTVTTGHLFCVAIKEDGAAGDLTELHPSQAPLRPDDMRP